MRPSLQLFSVLMPVVLHRVFVRRRFDKLLPLLAACVAFAGSGYAAESVKPTLPAPAVERDADAGQPGKPEAPAPKPPVTELRFDPPPVPEFMLRKPGKPLTIEEMKRQADEASEKARRARAESGAGSTTSGADAKSPGNSSKPPVN